MRFVVVVSALIALSCAQLPFRNDIFIAGQFYPCFRQPTLLATPFNILAFAEGRNNTFCAGTDDGFPLYIVLRTSTDGGSTWSPLVTLYTGAIDFFSAVTDTSNNVTWLLIQDSPNVIVLTSPDFGATWTEAAIFATPVSPQLTDNYPSVGHGIQLQSQYCKEQCNDVGRLLFSFVCNNASASAEKYVSCLIFSDDHGATWNLGAVAQPGSRESQAVQIWSSSSVSSLYVTERNMGTTPGHRMYAVSQDGGDSFYKTGIDNNLTSPVTANWTGIVDSVSLLFQANTTLVFSGVNDTTSRANLVIRISTDNGATWTAGKSLFSGPAGYSEMHFIDDGLVGILFENGNDTFADRISFSLLPASWLIDSD